MQKRTHGTTEERIRKWEKEGRGQGEGKDYLPWLTIQSFPSHGLSSRGLGWKTERIHHCLSNLEYDYLCLLEWNKAVTDIREQYPLMREDTLAIAEAKGIPHPKDPKTQTEIVMTTDFLITIGSGTNRRLVARTIKQASELDNKRVLSKLEIERAYWAMQDVDWGIVTEKELPSITISNIQWLQPAYYPPNDLAPATLQSYIQHMKTMAARKDQTIVKLTDDFDHRFNLETGTGLEIFKYLLARRLLEADIDRKPVRTYSLLSDVLIEGESE